jgi:hypothetical protein
VTGYFESGDELSGRKCVIRKNEEIKIVDNEVMQHLDPSSKSENGYLKLQSTFGKEMQEEQDLVCAVMIYRVCR